MKNGRFSTNKKMIFIVEIKEAGRQRRQRTKLAHSERDLGKMENSFFRFMRTFSTRVNKQGQIHGC